MVSSHVIPWYNRPPREFPAQRWLRQRYPFTVSPQVWARQAPRPPAPREFPAQRWVMHQSQRQ